MKITKFYAPLVALLLTGAAFTSCSSDDAKSEVVPANKNWSLSIEGAASGLDTRALSWAGGNSSVKSKWRIGETLEVYNVTQGATFRGYLTPKTDNVEKSDLVTTAAGLTGSFALNDELKIYYPTKAVTYMGQDGQFGTISQKYDYSSVRVIITDIDSENKALKATDAKGEDAVQFINQQALVKFNLFTVENEGTANEVRTPVTASHVTLSAVDLNNQLGLVQYEDPVTTEAVFGDIDIQIPEGQESDVVWAAVRGNENLILTVEVTTPGTGADRKVYRATTVTETGIRLQNGMYYEIPVPLKQVEAAQGSGSN